MPIGRFFTILLISMFAFLAVSQSIALSEKVEDGNPFEVRSVFINVEINNNLVQTRVRRMIINKADKDLPFTTRLRIPKMQNAYTVNLSFDGKNFTSYYSNSDFVTNAPTSVLDGCKLYESKRTSDGVSVTLSSVKGGSTFILTYTYVCEAKYLDGLFHCDIPLPKAVYTSGNLKDITMYVNLKCTKAVTSVSSPSHKLILKTDMNATRAKVENIGISLTKAFALSWGFNITPGVPEVMISNFPGKDTTFSFLLIPPDAPVFDKGRSIALILDKSGSMSGDKIECAKEALIQVISMLRPSDLLNVFTFDEETYALGESPVHGDEEGKQAAINFVERVCAGGFTRFLEPLCDAVHYLNMDTERLPAVVLLSDGIDNKDSAEIFVAEIDKLCNFTVPIFTFEIGSDANHHLLRCLADFSGAELAVIRSAKDIEPALMKIAVQLDSIVARDFAFDSSKDDLQCYPKKRAYLYTATPITQYGILKGRDAIEFSMRAVTSQGKWSTKINLMADGKTNNCAFLGSQWATKRMAALSDKEYIFGGKKSISEEMSALLDRYFRRKNE